MQEIPDLNQKKAFDTRPEWIKKNEVGNGKVEYDGREFFYTILDRNIEPRLPGFLGFPNGEHLFISEEVPEEFREPQLIHEIIEYSELNGKKGRCLEALKRELEIAQKKIGEEKYLEYLKYRKDFFANLVNFYKDSEDEEFKREIQASYEYLEKTLNILSKEKTDTFNSSQENHQEH